MLLRELMCIKGFLIQERCHGGEMGSGTVSLRVEERGCTLDGSPPSVTIDLHIFMYIIVWLITLLMGCVRLSATLESRRMASGKCKSHVDIGPIERIISWRRGREISSEQFPPGIQGAFSFGVMEECLGCGASGPTFVNGLTKQIPREISILNKAS